MQRQSKANLFAKDCIGILEWAERPLATDGSCAAAHRSKSVSVAYVLNVSLNKMQRQSEANLFAKDCISILEWAENCISILEWKEETDP